MKVLAFDIATTTGWAFGEKQAEIGGSFKFDGFYNYYRKCKELINLHHPDIIICAEATRFYTAQRRMNMLCGAMQTAADYCNVKVFEKERAGKGKKRKSSGFPIDSEMKKAVFGKGKVEKKEICERYNTSDEDEADARMFIEYFNLIGNDG